MHVGDKLIIRGDIHCSKRMYFLDDYSQFELLPDWFNLEWVPEHRNVAWIFDFPLLGDMEIKISPDEITFTGTLWAIGTTRLYYKYP
jgi:hypothetical protein